MTNIALHLTAKMKLIQRAKTPQIMSWGSGDARLQNAKQTS